MKDRLTEPRRRPPGDDPCDPHGHGVGSDSKAAVTSAWITTMAATSPTARSRAAASVKTAKRWCKKYRPGKGGGRGGSSDTIPDTTDYGDDS